MMGIVFLIITALFILRHKHAAVPAAFIAGVLLVSAYALPTALKPLYAVWMKAAFILGWINTRVILMLLFYLVFTPIGLVTRLMRLDLLERKLDKDKASYWKTKEKRAFNLSQYEKQF
jgi:hypothetical protein